MLPASLKMVKIPCPQTRTRTLYESRTQLFDSRLCLDNHDMHKDGLQPLMEST